jgi:hypothetical protein
VRRGASWTAAYYLQPTVAAVARPVGSSVVPSESLLLSGPGLLLAQTASARRSVQPTSSGQASSPWSTLPGHQPWHRSPVDVRHACPPIRDRRPGSGSQPSSVQPVQCPARPVSSPSGVQSPGVVVRVSGDPAVCCPPVRCPALWCPPVQRPAGWCPPHQSAASVSSPTGRWREPRSVRRAPVTTGTDRVAGGLPRRRAVRSTAQQAGAADGRCCRVRGLVSGGVGGGPGPGWVWRRRCPLRDQAGQAGVPSAPSLRRRCGTGGLRCEVAAPAAWLPSGLGGRPWWVVVVGPAAWVGGPGGADGLAGGDGRAAPARPRLAAGAPGSWPAAL